jgi:N-acyl-D-aspartate/D-glutamate deacylase
MGLDEAKSGREPTRDELASMCRTLGEAMAAGACGWSAQRTPPASGADQQRDFDGSPMVSDLMSDTTALALAGVLAERNEGFIELLMYTGDAKADQRHIEELARAAARPILYNTVTTQEHNPRIHRSVMAWITRCQREGLPIFGQSVMTDVGMTFTLEDWNLWDDSPAWQHALIGSPAERLAKLADPSLREALRGQAPKLFRLDNVTVLRSQTQPEVKDFTLAEVAARHGDSDTAGMVDALVDLVLQDDLRTVFWTTYGNTSDALIQELIEDPYLIPGTSDGGAHTKFFTAGRWPTEYLTKWVRDKGVLTLEQAHWAGSTLAAQIAGFTKRGRLVPGAPADVIVYDLDQLASLPSEVAHDLPADEWRRVQRATGYHRILVNGVITFEDGKDTGRHPGRLLRCGAD